MKNNYLKQKIFSGRVVVWTISLKSVVIKYIWALISAPADATEPCCNVLVEVYEETVASH